MRKKPFGLSYLQAGIGSDNVFCSNHRIRHDLSWPYSQLGMFLYPIVLIIVYELEQT